jgi:hypothetical protein
MMSPPCKWLAVLFLLAGRNSDVTGDAVPVDGPLHRLMADWTPTCN